MKSFLLVSTRTEVNGEMENRPVYDKPEIELTGTMQVCPACNSIILGQNAPKCICGQALVRSGSPAAEMSSIVNWKSGEKLAEGAAGEASPQGDLTANDVVEKWPHYLPATGVGAVAAIMNLWLREFRSSPTAEQIRDAGKVIDALIALKLSGSASTAGPRPRCPRCQSESQIPPSRCSNYSPQFGQCVYNDGHNGRHLYAQPAEG